MNNYLLQQQKIGLQVYRASLTYSENRNLTRMNDIITKIIKIMSSSLESFNYH